MDKSSQIRGILWQNARVHVGRPNSRILFVNPAMATNKITALHITIALHLLTSRLNAKSTAQYVHL